MKKILLAMAAVLICSSVEIMPAYSYVQYIPMLEDTFKGVRKPLIQAAEAAGALMDFLRLLDTKLFDEVPQTEDRLFKIHNIVNQYVDDGIKNINNVIELRDQVRSVEEIEGITSLEQKEYLENLDKFIEWNKGWNERLRAWNTNLLYTTTASASEAQRRDEREEGFNLLSTLIEGTNQSLIEHNQLGKEYVKLLEEARAQSSLMQNAQVAYLHYESTKGYLARKTAHNAVAGHETFSAAEHIGNETLSPKVTPRD